MTKKINFYQALLKRFIRLQKPMKKIVILISFFICHFSLFTHAQSSLRDSSVNGFLIGFSYGYQIPLGELSERFGNNGLVGAEVNYKLRNNFTFGIDGGYM